MDHRFIQRCLHSLQLAIYQRGIILQAEMDGSRVQRSMEAADRSASVFQRDGGRLRRGLFCYRQQLYDDH